MQLHPQTTTAEIPPAPLDGTGTVPAPPRSRLKRRLLWSAVIAAVLLLLIFVPPLINANRYRLQIARSMSESLGRPVHLDNVTLHLLPVPGLTLSNLVVSEDPAFGDEPTLRADSVEATLRLGSLWRRRVEFSTVRFIEPHVNLVRNAEGRWNLADVLLHASHVDTAPTGQRHAGPTPRFPYIEATGGRVNVKLAEEKLPFAITNADFALWLPSPRQWRVRLTGQPARTDIDITDPGVVRLEGDLQRAPTVAEVPVNLRATWHDTPMGQASHILTGNDLGWRGTLNVDAWLAGTLGAAQLKTRITLDDLRRADFAPAHPLDLQITCGAGVSVPAVTLSNLRCTMPDDAPTPMVFESASLNLQHPQQSQSTLTAQEIPLRWALLWAALFSPRVPTDLHPAGTVALNFEHLSAPPPPGSATPVKLSRRHRTKAPAPQIQQGVGVGSPWNQWVGTVQVELPAAPNTSQGVPGGSLPVQLVWRTGQPATPGSLPAANGLAFHLQPVSVRLAPDATVDLTGSVTPTGYTVSVVGSASPAALLLPARYVPQLGDGLDNILSFPPTALAPARVDFTCTRTWSAEQTCISLRPAAGPGKLLTVVPAVAPPQTTPALLTPHSLSPFDHASPLGGTPRPQP